MPVALSVVPSQKKSRVLRASGTRTVRGAAIRSLASDDEGIPARLRCPGRDRRHARAGNQSMRIATVPIYRVGEDPPAARDHSRCSFRRFYCDGTLTSRRFMQQRHFAGVEACSTRAHCLVSMACSAASAETFTPDWMLSATSADFSLVVQRRRRSLTGWPHHSCARSVADTVSMPSSWRTWAKRFGSAGRRSAINQSSFRSKRHTAVKSRLKIGVPVLLLSEVKLG